MNLSIALIGSTFAISSSLLLGSSLSINSYASTIEQAKTNKLEIKHYNKAFTPKLRAYTLDLLSLATKKAEEKYGATHIKLFDKKLSTNRSRRATEIGKDINVLFAADWQGDLLKPEKVYKIDQPVFFGMLGLRSFIINSGDKRFTNIDQVETLKHLRAGVGFRWVENDIFKFNNCKVVGAQQYNNLFPMLSNNRFDYIPLGDLEIKQAMEKKKTQFAIERSQSTKIFYPLPIYLYINNENQKLIETLRFGLNTSMQDGSAKALFEKHFFEELNEAKQQKSNLALFSNPRHSEAQNKKLTESFLSNYGELYNVLNSEKAVSK